ncbi:Peroxyureidoacrylate/ureidoacrylate amidohydrolase RutB [Ensifer adhaerens]|uniref:cysteine hydrolase family protein n=1 Tax=Ensifer adhaerens TaxID=106592 RepID=UPI001569F616|nr:isochorismatase family cysteine hydrolase [Ensifer adhaerens]NRP21560.1 Peroxyureidoacrylate/ureidoacrylate amidohydrolase RutB [Ensifer adhaerens]
MNGATNWRHICVDMQRMFAEDTPWHVPWMDGVKDQVVEVSSRHAAKTIFTRFIPPLRAEDVDGAWKPYYEKWWMMTREHLPENLVDILPELRQLVPPARIFDKPRYSPWLDGGLNATLREDGVTSLVISGGETDVCVLATMLGAIDLGYHTVVLDDAICGSADETHEAALKIFGGRFSVQLELVSTEAFLTRT